ncbi:Uncharacterised protein [Mycobacterium tuberculosis]|uniref:Uncharacterized protein n=1 Tax=Mycobacterium tuberculosis TaxID=1773 RepID=A0A655ANX0_MYCTX|nr:Uncharacterised protein [Mycobacterium tuberculosis]COV66498.1 Uncharacterised protein [Mycobacterium tuberculosis]COY73151.1 Uncharacterised protein [Mycobacterium tuberculosis]
MRRAQFDHGVRKFARLHWRPHEGPGTNLDVEHQCTRTLSQLLAHNRTGDQRQRFDGAGNVAQRIQLGIGWRQLAGGEDRGADVAKLLAHPLVGQIRGEPGDGFQLVQGAAGVAESAARRLGHCATAGGDDGHQWQRDFVTYPAGGMLVHGR